MAVNAPDRAKNSDCASMSGLMSGKKSCKKATDAALDFLEYLYQRTGCWYLTFAAYHSGEAGVSRAIRNRGGLRTIGHYRRTRSFLRRRASMFLPLWHWQLLKENPTSMG